MAAGQEASTPRQADLARCVVTDHYDGVSISSRSAWPVRSRAGRWPPAGRSGRVAGELQGSASIIAWQAHRVVGLEAGVRPGEHGGCYVVAEQSVADEGAEHGAAEALGEHLRDWTPSGMKVPSDRRAPSATNTWKCGCQLVSLRWIWIEEMAAGTRCWCGN